MSTEETPLLVEESQPELDHDAVYDRFTARRKRTIVALAAWAGLIPFFVSTSFIPTVPSIARDLDTTGAVISFSISLSYFVSSFASMTWASYSGFYGRRPIYLTTAPCIAIGSIGVGSATTVPALMFWRVIQAFGASGGMAVGSSVIGDIYKLEERGSALGVFFAASLLGAALAPVTGGLVANYFSWRIMQYSVAVASIVAFTLMYYFLPETSHPGERGFEKRPVSERGWVWLNPLKSLKLLRSPNLLALVFVSFAALFSNMVILVPIAYTLGVKYNIENEAIIGALFIPLGVGNFTGAPLAGRLSDAMVVKWRKRRHGEWIPEDRLRAAILGAGVLVPSSLILCGIFTTFVPGTLGIVLNMVAFFMNGLGVNMVLTPVAAYNVDVMRSQSSQLMSAHSGLRNWTIGLMTAAIIPSITTLGVLPTYLIAAGITYVGFGFLCATIKYGDQMRAWVDVGYSTAENN